MSVEPLLTDWELYERLCSDCAVAYQLEHIYAAAGKAPAPDETWWSGQISRHCATLPEWRDLTVAELADFREFVLTTQRAAS